MRGILAARGQARHARALRADALAGRRPVGLAALRAETSEPPTERSQASATARRRRCAAPAQAVNGVNWP